MRNTLFENLDFNGRSGLSRSLKSHFSGDLFYYLAWLMAVVVGAFTALDLFSCVWNGQYKRLVHWSSLLELSVFAVFLVLVFILRETKSLRIHIHGDRLYFENNDGRVLLVPFVEIVRIRFAYHKKVVPGFYLDLADGPSIHIPITLERIDYIFDALKYYRPDLCMVPGFMKARRLGLVIDHLASHHNDFYARSILLGLGFYLFLPFIARREYIAIAKNPSQVKRNRFFISAVAGSKV